MPISISDLVYVCVCVCVCVCVLFGVYLFSRFALVGLCVICMSFIFWNLLPRQTSPYVGVYIYIYIYVR